ncbi:MAG TPA: hypothetical protein VL443_21200, partial [Cyclobacteriaceae bacterium]|nr:hypothetical protein [Cyclobacteriaceae bacterium]
CGSRNSPSKACLLSAEDLPVWAFHGDADNTVPLSRTVNMVAAINKCLPLPNPLAKITIYPGVGHDAWDNAYRNDHTLHNPNVYEWMLSYTNTINGTNKIPVANAGLDIVKALPVNSVTLTSSSTDSDGKITSVNWKQLSGPSQTVFASTATTSSSLQVSGLVEGVYVFQLDVTDNLGDSDCDYVKITIAAPPTNTNMPPVTSAGPDRIIKLPSASNTLFGSAYDPDGKIISYKWVKVSGASCTLSSSSISRPKISGLTSGTYVFRLTSYDNNGVSSSDDITITADFPPVANAGSDVSLQLSSNPLKLKGSATDSDGSIASYVWAKYSGPTAVLTDKNTPTVSVSKLEAGTYVFRLTVKDDDGVSTSDYTTVIVLPLISGRDSTTAEVSNEVKVSDESKFILTDRDNPELVNSKIIVYNDLGQKIHEGPWSPDLYPEIFNRRGLYIFHLITFKGRKTGKIYVTDGE